MVVLINKLPKFHHKSNKNPKLDQFKSTPFQSFQSTLSQNLHKLFSDHHDSSPVSLSWYIPCFTFIKETNRAFERFIKDLDYPFTQWNKKLSEDYFTYTLNILDSLNSISSSISHLGFQRLSLSHGVSSSSSETRHLNPIIPKELKGFDWNEIISKEGGFNCGKERVVHEAMMKMMKVDKLILKVLFSGLSGSAVVDLGEFDGFDLEFAETTAMMVMIKEIDEVNRVVKRIEGAETEEVEELKRKLSEFERLIESVSKEVNCLFDEVLGKRNELIDCFRLPKGVIYSGKK